ncbi:hypothetical protein Snoj_24660 [Streptomyces nojiriensis]|uniref:Uncharacterized protein n=1 Tax=Streptomyces nojiriensis TaxID=66374 RepID=A0ABQ3SK71_9ACTN|nr:hypothetical protein GCM10010205_61430 [Streptomyces nojiriensis]GHI68548.1 hypothetical protein Snoj_24660 [Streptomyces nojiriensis]
MGSARVAVKVTSNVLHGKTSKSGSVDPDFDGFDGVAVFFGAADFDAVALGPADALPPALPLGTAVGLALGVPDPPAAPSSVGPQAVRASADTAARAMAALRTVLMMVVPPGECAERAGLGRAG